MDTYQPVDMPTSLTECIPCSTANASPQKGTMGSGTAKQDDCKGKYVFLKTWLNHSLNNHGGFFFIETMKRNQKKTGDNLHSFHWKPYRKAKMLFR